MLTSFHSYLLNLDVDIQEHRETFIVFKKNRLQFLFVTETSDPFYFRVILPNIAEIRKDNKQKIDTIINLENSKFKVAKAVIAEHEVWVSAEQFVYSKDNINNLFDRILSLLEGFVIDFKNELKKTNNNEAEKH